MDFTTSIPSPSRSKLAALQTFCEFFSAYYPELRDLVENDQEKSLRKGLARLRSDVHAVVERIPCAVDRSDLAKDVMGDVLLAIGKGDFLKRYSRDISSARTYVRGCVRYIALAKLRKERRGKRSAGSDVFQLECKAAEDAAEDELKEKRLAAISKAFQMLPPKDQQSVLVMYPFLDSDRAGSISDQDTRRDYVRRSRAMDAISAHPEVSGARHVKITPLAGGVC